VYTQVEAEGRIIALGSDEYFDGTDSNRHLLNNMLSYLCNGSVNGSIEEEVPKSEYNLSCYPNPFNPSTEIRFTAKDAEDAKIEIYNIKGQRVMALDVRLSGVEVRQSYNSYTITWQGTDQNNNPVSSGVYLYQLKVGNEVKVQEKMVLLK